MTQKAKFQIKHSQIKINHLCLIVISPLKIQVKLNKMTYNYKTMRLLMQIVPTNKLNAFHMLRLNPPDS